MSLYALKLLLFLVVMLVSMINCADTGCLDALQDGGAKGCESARTEVNNNRRRGTGKCDGRPETGDWKEY